MPLIIIKKTHTAQQTKKQNIVYILFYLLIHIQIEEKTLRQRKMYDFVFSVHTCLLKVSIEGLCSQLCLN